MTGHIFWCRVNLPFAHNTVETQVYLFEYIHLPYYKIYGYHIGKHVNYFSELNEFEVMTVL